MSMLAIKSPFTEMALLDIIILFRAICFYLFGNMHNWHTCDAKH